ncbi:hypothetical protein [Burkholderia sp. Ac-20353]|uniref:hypothetical protein n=1 Tax=Burkholderia sp. Ac-20353 TaxID=2703894 RepID=UPI00197CA6A9|nr:hypothetical protein [Burkholderia sp. Ac-20353]MBN3786811.1 hypothetical protein [Burkholderia sp. Ac-20353]
MNNEDELSTCHFSTIGALTERWGHVTKSASGLTLAGLQVARMGDVLTYDDGSEAVVIDDPRERHSDGKSFALVGNRLSNGDT